MVKQGIIFIVMLCISLTVIQAQSSGPYRQFQTIKGPSLSFYQGSSTKRCYLPEVLTSPKYGTFEMKELNPDYKWEFKYKPLDTTWIGQDTVVIKYKDKKDQTGKVHFIAAVYNYLNSYVETRPDYIEVGPQAQNITIEPLTNDSSSLDSTYKLSLKALTNFNRASGILQGDSAVKFSVSIDSGMAYINYQTCDYYNICRNGVINILVVDPAKQPLTKEFRISTPEDQPVELALDISNYTVTKNAAHGSVETADYSLRYIPFADYYGKDTIILTKGNIERKVFITVFSMPESTSYLASDEFVTAKNTAITFDVSKNDVRAVIDLYNILIDQNPTKGTLTKLSDKGEFKYEPEAGYEGIQTFTYKVCPQGICEKVEVRIIIGNHQPKSDIDYFFTTPKNTPLVLNYHVPFNAYNFSSNSGLVSFYPGWDTLVIKHGKNSACTSVSVGYNQLLFSPGKDFVDTTQFTITYCLDSSGQCKTINCQVNVIDEVTNCNKQCVGGDCVWPGDVNLDGIVNMLDLLNLGYALGYEGPSRNYDDSYFRALKCNNWDKSLPGNNADIKNADTDGNGKVNCNDKNAISNFYHKNHSLVPDPVYDKGAFPFILNVLTPDADSGDLAMIEVQLGDEVAPAINITGYSYELDYNKDIVVDSSLAVMFYEYDWFATGASTINLYKKPWDGRLESGFVRGNSSLVSGKGGVEVITCIIEDDVDGFRRDEDYILMPFYFRNIITQDGDGRKIKLEDNTAYIKIKRERSGADVLDPAKLLVYPNPASTGLQFHLNGKNSMLSYTVISLDGKTLVAQHEVDAKHNILTLDDLKSGMYLLRVETALGPITKKFQIMR